MEFYYGLIGILTLAWLLLRLPKRSKSRDKIYIVFAFALLAAVSAARYCVGFDYAYVYAPQYDHMLITPGYSFSDIRFEPGFVLLEMIIARFSSDFHMLFVVTSILLMALFAIYTWRNSPNPFVSVFLFLTLSQYYCTMDFVRQSIAAAITTLSIPLLKQRKASHYILYVGVVLLAATFHKSALVMLLFLFVNMLPIQRPLILGGFSLATALLYFNTQKIMDFVTRHWYETYSLQNEHVTATFTPQFTIAMFCCFLLLLLGSKILTAKDKGNYLYVNYAFFSFFFVLMGTRHSILDRLSMYFMFAIPVGIAILLEELAKQEDGASIFAQSGYGLKYRRGACVVAWCVVVAGSLSIHHYALTMDHHGVVPYDVIWRQPFYAQYKEWQKEAGDEPELIVDPALLDSDPVETAPEISLPQE